MVRTRRTPSFAAVTFFSLLALALAAPAAAWQLHGVVYGDSLRLAGASVALSDAATGEVVGSSRTSGAGAYAFAVADGAYDLLVEAEGHQPATVVGVRVAGADVVQDVALVTRPSLGGAVRTSDGAPVAGAQVLLLALRQGSGYLPVADPVTTDAEGRYAFPLAASGISRLQVANPFEQSPLLPQEWSYTVMDFEVGGRTTRDATLPPVTTLSGTVTGDGGAPVPGTWVRLNQYPWVPEQGWYGSVASGALAAADGTYAVRVFAARNTDLLVQPPPETGYSAVNLSLDMTAGQRRDFALSRPLLYGVVRTAEGLPAAGAQVSLLGSTAFNYYQVIAGPVTTDAEGRYAFDQAPFGEAYLEITGSAGADGPLPVAWRCMLEQFSVDGLGPKDFTLPKTGRISGRAAGPDGAPVPGVRVRLDQFVYARPWIAEVHVNAPDTDASGLYAVHGFAAGSADLSARAPEATGYSPHFKELSAFWGDRQVDFALSRVVLSGVLRTGDGVPVPGAEVVAYGATLDGYFQQLAGPVTTDDRGRYVLDGAPAGLAYLNFANPSDHTGQMPDDWRAMQLKYDVAASAVRDVTLPRVATLSGKTTDANGVPVDDVVVTLDKNLWDGTWYVAARGGMNSRAEGDYAARAFALGPTTLTVQPPWGSGFAASAPVDFAVTADRLLTVVLEIDDTAPPVILAGPIVTKLTETGAVVEWLTSEPARGGLRYGTADPPGTQVDEEALAVAHAVALEGLAPDTLHYASVFATDFAGNGPVESGVVSFRTLAAPDTAPPAFLAGPVVTAVTHAGALVSWTTDEACTGTVFHGADESLGETAGPVGPGTAQAVALSGLAPATAYFARVDCEDAAGNAVSSSLLPFTTSPAPDADPPRILDGPLVVAVTATTATVEWTTDEPATSGVSWNDGTRHGLVTDPALVVTHRVTVTGLAPATLYHLTVSSTDGAGNGPTLGGPVDFTTSAVPDTRPPVILLGPEVVNVTHQSAVIRWETDEPTDGVVEYGLAPDALALRAADATLASPHNQALTGLAASTVHFFRVCSTDAAGNTGCSPVGSFTTDAHGGGAAPAVSGLQVLYAADRTATVAWTTDAPTDSVVRYAGPGGAALQRTDGAKTLRHQVTLAGLDPATAYAVRVGGTDLRGVAVGAGAITLATAAAPDAAPPVIVAGPTVVATDTLAVVAWTTDEIADSLVRYGRDGQGVEGQVGSIARTTEHRVVLTNLAPGSRYHLRVLSADPAGNGPTAGALVPFETRLSAPVFTEDFSDGTAAGDADWQQVAGDWSAAGGVYASAPDGVDQSLVARWASLDAPFVAGAIRAKVRLEGTPGRSPNGALVFSWRSPERYRYVQLVPGAVVVGQVGRLGGVAGGVKRRFAAAVVLGRAVPVTVTLAPGGRVRVFVRGALAGAYAFPSLEPGAIGLAAAWTRTLFDDVAVWDAAAP